MSSSAMPVSRRRALTGAAWSVPVIAMGAAAPAKAASTAACVETRIYIAARLQITGISHNNGVWDDNTYLEVDVTPSAFANRHFWAMFSDTAGVSHTLLSLSYSITFPHPVSWSTTNNDWPRTVNTSVPGQWTYTWTPTTDGTPLPRTMTATTPLETSPGVPNRVSTTTNSLVIPTFSGTVPHSTIPTSYRDVGDAWYGTTTVYPTRTQYTYRINSPACAVRTESVDFPSSITVNHNP